jgi:hypothetical protein
MPTATKGKTASRTKSPRKASTARRTPAKRTSKARTLVDRVGRPSALTEDLMWEVADLILEGNYRTVAAAACGVSRMTLHNWVARGEELEGAEDLTSEQQLYVDFAHVMRICEARSESELLQLVAKGETGWQAHMTILERRFPARWKRRDELEVAGEVHQRVTLSPEEEAKELAAFGMPAALAVAAGPEAVQPPEEA